MVQRGSEENGTIKIVLVVSPRPDAFGRLTRCQGNFGRSSNLRFSFMDMMNCW